MSITQTAAPDPAIAGVPLTYTLNVANEGPDQVPGVTVFDTLPDTVGLVSATPDQGVCNVEVCGGELWCELGALDAGQGATVAIEVMPWVVGAVTNSAEVPIFNDPDRDDNRSVAETTVLPASTTSVLLSIDRYTNQLRVIDPITGSTLSTSGAVTLAGERVGRARALATHPETGELWALLSLGGQAGYELVTLDPTSGEAGRIGNTGDTFIDLTFDANGNLYGLSGMHAATPDSLFLLSQSDATASLVLSLDGGLLYEGIAFHPRDGLLYHAWGSFHFQAIDLSGPTTTEITTCPGSSDFEGGPLIHLGGDAFLFVEEGDQLNLVTAGGILRRLGRLDHYSNGLALVDLPFADLSVSQTAAPDPVAAGGRLTYTLTVTNHGPDDFPEATVTDSLPGTVSLVSATPSQGVCSLEPCGGLVCALGALAAGDLATVELAVRPLAPGTVTNQVLVPSLNDPNVADNQAELATTVTPGAATPTLFSIDRRSDQLRIIDPSDGRTVASRAITLAGDQIEGGEGLATHPVTGELWALLALAGRGTSELVTLNPATAVATRIGDTGSGFTGLAFDSQGTLWAVTDHSASEPNSLFILSQSDAGATWVLELSSGHDQTLAFNPQDGLLYHAAGDFTLESVDPRNPAIIESTRCHELLVDHAAALTHLGGNTLLLAADYSFYGLTTAGSLSYVGQLDHESKGLTFVPEVPLADLSVTQVDAPDPVAAGSPLTYTLNVTNHGPDAVPDLTVLDALPGTVELVSATPSQGTCTTELCGSLSCTLGELGAGEHATVAVEVTPLVPGTVNNTVLVPVVNDSEPANNQAVETTTVLAGTSAAVLLSIDGGSDQLRVIDPDDGSTLGTTAVRLPGSTVVGGEGLAVDPRTGELWALVRLSDRSGLELVTLDPVTGVARRIGTPGENFTGLAFDSTGTLYSVKTEGSYATPASLHTLSQTDAASSFVAALAEDSQGGQAIAFNPRDGHLYFASGRLRLRAVALGDLTITDVASCWAAVATVRALTHLGGDVMLLVDVDSQLHAVTAGGGLTHLGAIDHPSRGLALVAALPSAEVSLTQEAVPDPVAAGSTLTYTLTIANDGPDNVPALALFDTLPAAVTLISATPSQGVCELDPCGPLSCALGELGAGERATVTLEVTPLAAGTITNTVSVPALADPDLDDNQAVLDVNVRPGSSTPVLFSVDRYSDLLRVVDPATGATLSSRAITLVGATVTAGRGLATHPETGELWALLELAGQNVSELVTTHPTTGEARRVGTTGDHFVSLAFDGNGTLYALSGRNASTPNSLFTLSQTDATPSLELSLPVDTGGSIAFNPLVRRLYHASGAVTLQAIDLSGPTFTDVAICSFVHPMALTHLGGRTMLLAGSGDWEELYAVTTLGGLQRLGRMDHETGGLAVVDRPLADLSVTQTASPDPVIAGAHLTFTVTVANHGPGEAAGVTVFDTLPGTVSVVSASPSQGVCLAEACGDLVCALGELAAGEVATVTIEVVALVPGMLTHTAFAPALGDPDLGNNQAVLETMVHSGASTPRLLSTDRRSDQLRVIDPSDGSTLSASTITLAGATVEGADGLATHPLTGEPWALLRLEDQEGPELVTLSPAAGVAWRVGNTGDDFAGLAFDSDGTLYGVTGTWAGTPEALFILSQTDASPTFVLSLADGREGEAITFHAADGLLYHASGREWELSFRSIDLSGPTITSIATCGSADRATALTNLGGDVMLLADDYRHLCGITSGGGLRGIGSMDHESTGLAFVDVVFADLAVTISDAADPITVGEDLTLTLTVTNNGPEQVPSVIVFGTLPGSFEPARIFPSQGVCATAPCAEGLVCALGALDAGQYATVTIEVTPLVAGTGTSTAFAPALGDPDLDNNRATRTTTVLPGASVPALLSIGADSDRLRIIDPSDGTTAATFTITLEGETVVGGNGLATDPLTGELWALLRLEGQSGRELVTLDPATGVATRVGDTLDRFAGLAFDSDGTLYGVTGRGATTPEALFILSPSDATSTWVLSLADGSGGEAIAFDPADGLLYHASGELAFRAIDLSETTVTTIADCNAPSPAAALTYLGGNTLLLADKDSSLFALTTSGNLTPLGSLDHRSKGLAFVELDLAAPASRDQTSTTSSSTTRQIGSSSCGP